MGIMKVIPREIKQEILAKVKTGGRVMELAEQYGISDKTIYYWLRQNAGEEIVSVVKYNKLRRENEELKKLLGEVTLKLSLGEKN
jgi:transposase-like protein